MTNFQVATEVFDQWRENVLTGAPPQLFPIGEGALARVEIGPKLVTLIGGAPGAGKTAFTMQCVIDALRLTPNLRASVCNIEMPPEVLLDRQLSRLSGVSARDIRYRQISRKHVQRIDWGMNTLGAVADRICFVRPPFDLANAVIAADAFGAKLMVLDYIQRIRPPGKQDDQRGSVNETMDYVRQFADTGVAVVVVAAVARTKDSKGRSSYDAGGLSLASFRESSELEFGADDAFILAPSDDEHVTLKHLKARHTEALDIDLVFDKSVQSFTPHESLKTESADLAEGLRAAWNNIEDAPDVK